MKIFLILGLMLSLSMEHRAEAYSSNVGAGPKNDDPGQGLTGYGDLETKAIVKSATAAAEWSTSRARSHANTPSTG